MSKVKTPLALPPRLLPLMRGRYRVPSSNGSALHSASGVWSTRETVRLSSDAGTPPLLSLLLSPSLLRVLRSRGLAPLFCCR